MFQMIFYLEDQILNFHFEDVTASESLPVSVVQKNPDLITSTQLRKQLVTMCQVLGLTENNQDILAKFLGHDIRVQRDYYRLPDSVYQLGKVTKVLHTINSGSVSKYAGKNFEEIEFSNEDTLQGESLVEEVNSSHETDDDEEFIPEVKPKDKRSYKDAAWTLMGSSEFAVAGEKFTMTCDPQDSNAVAVSWKRLDIDTVFTGTARATIDAQDCKIGLGSDTQYQYTCEPGPIYKLTIPANVITNSQNNKVWSCESIFGGAGGEYKVKVQVPVSNVSIYADIAVKQQVNVIYDNKPTTFYCITNGCRPKTNVTVTTTGVTKGQLTESSTQNGDLIITRVSQVITANRGGSTMKTIQCSAVNIQGKQPVWSQLITLDVYYIPSVEPTLTGYTNGTVLYEGDSDLTITCQQSGCYPLSVITWSCDGKLGTINNGQTVASSYVQLTVNRNLNRKTCICTVRHPDNNLAYTKTLSVTITVYYAPTTPTLQTSDTIFPWVENTQGVIRCTTTPGYPSETTYDWLQNSQFINGQTTDTYTIPTLSNVHNGLRIQCRVSNLYTVQRPPAKISDILTLNVQYTPIIALDTTIITTQEGYNLSRRCSAIGNPAPTVKWYRGSSEQTSGTGTSATLVFGHIDRNQADTYQCKATATRKLNFESSKSVLVVVYYPPAVTVNIQNTTENDTNVVFTCIADGFPTNYTYHGWNQYISKTLVRTHTDFTGMLSKSNRKITITKVTFEDIGRYYCSVENGFHGRKPDVLQQGSSYFDVRASAKFEPKEETRKPGALHKHLAINIKFYCNPPAVHSGIKWIKKTYANPLTNSDGISLKLTSTVIQRFVYGKVVTLNGQAAILTIATLQSSHLGHYQLRIQNGGNLSSSFDFQIIIPARPEPPKNLIVFEAKHNSVSLTWERGYDGGYHQTFVILVQDVESYSVRENLIDDDATNNNLSTTIEDLLPSATYNIKIYAMNENGNSSFLSVVVLMRKTLTVPLCKSCNGNRPVITTSVIIVILCVINIVLAIIIWRRGHCFSIKGNGSKHGEKSEIVPNYESVSQNHQETNLYEGIQTDQENQSESRGVDTYESLEARGALDVNTENTYQSLQTTDRPDSSGIAMELYENTQITT